MSLGAITQLALQVQKVLENKDLEAGQFEFVLYDAEGNPLQTKANAANGQVLFDAIEYTAAGTYTYTVKELIPTGDTNGITYDTRTAEITVTVTDNGDGTLTAVADYTNGNVFTNTYTPPLDPTIPNTGDTTPILLVSAMGISGLGILVLLAVMRTDKRKKEN